MHHWKREYLGKLIVTGFFVVCLLIAPGLPGFLLAVGIVLVWILFEITRGQ
jgi:hypothetical protein